MTKTVALGLTEDEAALQEEREVAWLLSAVAEGVARHEVRKTTLSALIDAIEEQPDAAVHLSVRDTVLSDVLLLLRHRGLVQLTDNGFGLTESGALFAREGAPEDALRALQELVSRKLQEWRLAPATR